MIKAIDYKEIPKGNNPHGFDTRLLYDTEFAQVVHITLAPGESLKRHITPVDAIFYVLEGKGTVEIGDESLEVSPEILIDSPAKLPHRWINNSNTTLRVLVIKVPRQTQKTVLL
jgi:mannose-6-phosphate isomerase-like protein (cupin superfamily)